MSIKLLDLSALRKLPPVEMLASTHLQKDGLNIIFGPSGSYKSFYAIGLALEIAKTHTAVYVAAEGSSGLAPRIDAWLGYKREPDPFLISICSEVDLLKAESVKELITELKKLKPAVELVIIDTYARCMLGGDENSARDAGIVINHCAAIQRSLRASILLIHHTNKAERGERGSGALRGGADVMIEVTVQNDDIEITCSKSKETATWPKEVFRFLPFGQSGLLLPADQVPRSTSLTAQQVKILEFLRLDVFDSPGATTRQICNGTGIAESSVYKILSELKRNSHVNQDKKGDPYSISPIGEAVLKTQLSKSAAVVSAREETEIGVEVSDSSFTLH